MILLAVHDETGVAIELGRDYNFETAYKFIAENETDFDNPKWPDCDLILTDGQQKWAFETGCWCEID